MERIKNLNYKKITIILLIITPIIIISTITIYNKNYLKNYIIKRSNEWDITFYQNSSINGELMGFMYEKDYDINSIPSNYISSIIINNYITNDNSFYDDSNVDEYGTYKKQVTNKKINEIIQKLFGPGSQIKLENTKYGCNFQAVNSGSYYTISARNPDDCGAFSESDDFYISHISNAYYDKEKNIIVEKKVGFIDTTLTENANLEYVLYSDKSKKELLNSNYNTNCIFNEKPNSICYKELSTYKIMLKKASNNKYYFYKIWKEK